MSRLGQTEKDPQGASFAELCAQKAGQSDYSAWFSSREYTAGECLRNVDDPITELGLVVSGILRAVQNTWDGREFCNAYFEQGDSFPDYLYLTGKADYTYRLCAETRATVLWIPTDRLERLLDDDSRLVRALMLQISRRGLKEQLYLNCLHYLTIRERVAYWIVSIQRMEPHGLVRMPRSQTVFANLLHVNRSSLNQELKLMEREGYFIAERGEMRQIDLPRLRQLL